MDWVNQPCNNTRVPPEHSLFPLQHWPETQGMAGVFQMPAAIGFRSGANPWCAKLQEEKKVFLTQLCSPHASGLPSAGSLQHLQDRHILTLIIWDRSPASASSRTMLSSLSSMKESKYLIMLGWFSCCRGRECKSSSYSVVRAAPAPPVSHICTVGHPQPGHTAPDKPWQKQHLPQTAPWRGPGQRAIPAKQGETASSSANSQNI